MTLDPVTFGLTLNHMDKMAAIDPSTVPWAAMAWLQDRSSGMPLVSLMQDTARSDAMFWAETASPIELECYMLAAAKRLDESASGFHGRQIKRLVAALWNAMTEEERKVFLLWIQKKAGEK